MNDSNAFASLSSSLLARKGHAKPAMRPQGFHVQHETGADPLDDLGWNDMGPEPRSPRLVALSPLTAPASPAPDAPASPAPASPVPASPVPASPVPVRQQAEIAREFENERDRAPLVGKAPRAAPGSKAKAAFTLRLDADRHLRLRLVCAVNHRSAQQIVTMALDEFLARHPENAALAAQNISSQL